MERVGSSAKDDDFNTVKASAEFIERQLKADETFLPELDWQYEHGAEKDPEGAFKVFLEPYKSGFTRLLSPQSAPLGPNAGNNNANSLPMMKLHRRIDLPADLLRKMEGQGNVNPYSYMGILSEINRIWVTVDNVLYLWDYMTPGSQYEEVLNMNTTTAIPNTNTTSSMFPHPHPLSLPLSLLPLFYH